MPSLFLSYRRADSPDTVRLLRDRIAARFRHWDVFYDHLTLPPGEPFPDVLRSRVAAADVVLVVVGPRWLDELRARVGQPGVDFVREEVKLALAGGRGVLPVTVGHAPMPSAADLADFPELVPLADRNAVRVRPDPDLEPDLAKLLDVIDGFGPGAGPGTLLGNKYKLVREIGAGGMGVVFLAEQANPRRDVAVKLVKPGMDSREVLARFDAEREALGRMKHPHIAGVLDAGTTPAGRPYFVMEYVRGEPITAYCDGKRLPVAERLKLFQKVCDAVQHAHQRGIVHRDISPTNVLVETADGKPVPKVIDFGLAKALGGKLTEMSLFTPYQAFVGKLEYASPEQAAGEDVDTRTDVYSLGALLYELLSGSPPFSLAELRKAGDDAARRIVKESDPPRLEKRLSSAAGRSAVAAARGSDSARLGREVRGELDWIVTKGLDKDRERRYATAAAFGEDVGRYLGHEPVTAGRPSAAYRVRKFVRRNRGPVAAAGLVFAALVSGVAGTTWGMVKAEAARVRAEAAEEDAKAGWVQEAQQKKEAEQQRTEAVDQKRRAERGEQLAKEQTQRAEEGERQANDQRKRAETNEQKEKAARQDTEAVLTFFQGNVLAAGRPKGQAGGLGRDVTLRQAVDAAEAKIGPVFRERPLVEAAVRNALGLTYLYLGEPGLSLPQSRRAYDLRTTALGPDHPDTLTSLNNVAGAYESAGDVRKAIPLYEDCLKRRTAALGPDHPDTLTSLNNVAGAYESAGDVRKAIPLYEDCLKRRTAALGPDHPDTLTSLNNVAGAYRAAGDVRKAIPLYEDCLKRRTAALGPDHPNTLTSLNNVAGAYRAAGDVRKAIPLYEDCLKRRTAALGPDHPDTLTSLNNVAGAYRAAGDVRKAIPLYEDCLKRTTAALGPDHPNTLTSLNNVAGAYESAGDVRKAIPLYEDCLKRRTAALGPDHPNTLTSLNNVAGAYRAAGDVRKAIPLYEDCLKRTTAALGPDHPDTLTSLNNVAGAYRAAGDVRKAIPLYEDCLKRTTAALGPDHPNTLTSLNNVAGAYESAGDVRKAIPLYEDCLKRRTAALGPDHPDTLTSLNNVAFAYQAAGDVRKAIPLYEDCLKRTTAALGPDHPDTLTSLNNVAGAYRAAGDVRKAIPLYEDCLKRTTAALGPDHPNTLTSLNNVAGAYESAGDVRKAIPLYEDCLKRRTAALGPDHPNTLTSLNNVAGAYESAGDVRKAIPLYEDCLKRSEAKLGPDHPSTLTSMGNLALAYRAVGRLTDALPLFENELLGCRKQNGDEHDDTLARVENLIELYTALREYPPAVKLARELFAARRPNLPADSPDLIGAMADLAQTLLAAGLDQEAEIHFRNALAIADKKGFAAWGVHETRSDLGAAMLGQKNYADAEAPLVAGAEGMLKLESKIPDAARPRLREAVGRVIRLYEATDRPAEAAKWRAKLPPERAPSPRLAVP